MHTDLPVFISFTMYQNRMLVKMSYQLQPNRAGTEHYVTTSYKAAIHALYYHNGKQNYLVSVN
jgi:hypothetical protein